MLEALSELSLRDVAFRRALPIGFGTGQFNQAKAEEEFSQLSHRMAQMMDFGKTATGFSREFDRTRHRVLRDHLLQVTQLKSLSAESIVVARGTGNHLIERTKEKVIVHHSNTRIEFPAYVENGLAAILSGVQMRIADIDSDLDLPGKLTLARRLIEEGLLRTVLSGPEV